MTKDMKIYLLRMEAPRNKKSVGILSHCHKRIIKGRCGGQLMTRPFYTSFSWAYDLLIDEPIAGRLQFIIEMLAQTGIRPGAHVLDAGCGTGRYSIALAERGFHVTGIDSSPEQIAEAGKKWEKSKAGLDFIVSDICTRRLTTGFDAILCRGVLNDITEDTLRCAVFSIFAETLRPGGMLILDVREWYATEIRKRKNPVFVKEVDTDRGRLRFQSITALQPETRSLIVSEKHEMASGAETFTFTMRCWTQEELNRNLVNAGFGTIRFFGDYDQSRPAGSSDRIVVVSSLKR
jgi:SAM-dependent methyltransferase